MDQLEKLKGAWKSQDYSEHKVSTTDIYKMIHAKSSSYVKWIFYISIIEFVLMNSIVLFRDMDKDMEFYEQMGLSSFITITSIITYTIVFGFIYCFYRNFKKIKVDSSAKALMTNILKMRNTVKYYIYFNIGAIAVIMIILFYFIFSSPENIALYKLASNIPQDFSNSFLLISVILIVVVIIGIILLVYRIIYGILLRRLKNNYKELEQLDK